MTVIENVLDKLARLPEERQREVLDFVEFLAEKRGPHGSLVNPEGLWAGGTDVTPEDIAAARSEMWGNA